MLGTPKPQHVALVNKRAQEVDMDPEVYAKERLQDTLAGLKVMNPESAEALSKLFDGFEGSKVSLLAIMYDTIAKGMIEEELKDFPGLEKEPVS